MTETRIIEVAIEMINQEGFANLSFKKVSKKLVNIYQFSLNKTLVFL